MLNQSIIIFLATLSLAIAFGGSKYGFDKLYSQEFIKKFKEYEEKIRNSFYFSLREIGLKSFELSKNKEEIDKKIENFMNEYRNYQDNIKGLYNELLNNKKNFSRLFLITTILLVLNLIKPDFTIFSLKIENLGLISLIFSCIVLVIFWWQLTSLETSMANYEATKPTFKETVEYIINKITKK